MAMDKHCAVSKHLMGTEIIQSVKPNLMGTNKYSWGKTNIHGVKQIFMG